MEITYDQGSKIIDHEFIKFLIEAEYEISSKPRTLENPMSNTGLEQIQQILGNIVRTYNITQNYVDKDEPWLVI